MQDTSSFESVFEAFAHGTKEMDGVQFAKLTRDCDLLDDNLTSIDVDIIFAKIKDKAHRKINFSQFQKGIEELANKKGISSDDLTKQIQEVGGPHFHGTKPDNVRLHDDKSTYTGVYAHGGPTTVDSLPETVPDF